MTEHKRRSKMRCFLSSPRLIDTAQIRRILRDLNIEVGSVDDLPTAGELPTTELLNQIRSASFVLGVLTEEGSSAVLLELGIAIGLGKPVFLIAEDKASLATTLLGLPLVVSPLTAIDTLRFHLEAFIANLILPRRSTPSGKKPVRFYGGGEAVPDARSAPSMLGTVIERRVADAFMRVGGSVTMSLKLGTGAEADMIVWLPGALDIGAGGPLLVEVKASAKQRFPEGGLRQLERLIEQSHLRAAVLVTDTAEEGIAVRMLQGAYLYAISISELERLAEADALLPELIIARNRLAHGVYPL